MWIKLKEEKPKMGDEVVFFSEGEYHIGYLVDTAFSSNEDDWLWCSYNVTTEVIGTIDCWMPLPPLPEDVAQLYVDED